MSQILKLTHENQQLKRQISQYKQVLGVSPFVDDSLLKGGYRVVKTIEDRDKIDCCHRKQGMKVIVIGDNFSYKEYVLRSSDCKTNQWEEVDVTVDVTVDENEVFLIEDYSELGENLSTQRDLNLVLKQILQNLQTQINNIELTDEKVQITEDTDFAQIGQTQKDFNRSVSDYKELVDSNIQDLQIDAKTTENVTSTTTVGAINAGQTIEVGTNIQKLTELLLNKTFYPTFVNPTFGLTNNAGLREVGSSFNVSLTFNFNRGQILGKLDNGIWNPTMLQDYRAGTAISYLLNNVSGANNSASFNVTTNLGTNTLNGSVTYAEGVKPKDSKNNDYDSPLSSGTSPIQSTYFEGIYPYFYYKSTSPITPEIMQSAIANGQATKVLASSTGTITIPFLPSGEYIAVAYPATSTTKTKWYVTPLDNGDIPGGVLGGINTLPCNSPTGLWNNVNFKIHVSAGVLTQHEAVQLKNS